MARSPIILYDFNKLDLNHRCEATWQHGECIGERDEDGHRILLYDLNSFSVAIWYHEATNKIVRADGFRSTRLLEQFVDDVDLSELLRR